MLAVFTEAAVIPSVELWKNSLFSLESWTHVVGGNVIQFCLVLGNLLLSVVRDSPIHQKAVWYSSFLLSEASLCTRTKGWYPPTQL